MPEPVSLEPLAVLVVGQSLRGARAQGDIRDGLGERHALTDQIGPEGRILSGVLAYESGNFDNVSQSGVSLLDIARAYREALDWTTDAAMQLT